MCIYTFFFQSNSPYPLGFHSLSALSSFFFSWRGSLRFTTLFFLAFPFFPLSVTNQDAQSQTAHLQSDKQDGAEGGVRGGGGRKRDSGNISKFDLAEKIADIWYLTYLILLMRSDKIESMCVNRYVCLRVCVRYWYRDKSIVSCGFN